jgi:hypothetical protein
MTIEDVDDRVFRLDFIRKVGWHQVYSRHIAYVLQLFKLWHRLCYSLSWVQW